MQILRRDLILENEDMKMVDYRKMAEDVFYSIYALIQDFGGKEGLNFFWKKYVFSAFSLDHFKQKHPNQNEKTILQGFVMQAEVNFFALKSLSDGLNLVDGKSNPYVQEIIKLSLNLPREDCLIKSTFLFYQEIVTEIRQMPDDVI